jgi:hypothetical protein
MKSCIKVADLTSSGGLSFDLIDLVSLLGERGLRSSWRAFDVWSVQEGDDGHFEDLCQTGQLIPGAEFASALKHVMQVIDGRFEAFEEGREEPWVVVEAIDSSYFLLHAEEDILQKARARFRSVSDYPNEKRA